jgi:hypothetical protein
MAFAHRAQLAEGSRLTEQWLLGATQDTVEVVCADGNPAQLQPSNLRVMVHGVLDRLQPQLPPVCFAPQPEDEAKAKRLCGKPAEWSHACCLGVQPGVKDSTPQQVGGNSKGYGCHRMAQNGPGQYSFCPRLCVSSATQAVYLPNVKLYHVEQSHACCPSMCPYMSYVTCACRLLGTQQVASRAAATLPRPWRTAHLSRWVAAA